MNAHRASRKGKVLASFANRTELPNGVTHSRTGVATMYDASGALAFGPHNMLKYSADLDNAIWTKALVTVTANAANMPDGTQTMDKIVSTAATGAHYLSQAFTFTGIGIHSFYARAGEWSCIALANSPNNYVYFNLANGTVSSLGNGWGSAGMIDMGGGLWRCWAKNSTAQTWGQVQTIIVSSFITSGNTGPACVGDGTSGLYAGGLQFQQTAQETLPTTYIPTTSAAVYGARFTYDPVALTVAGLLVEPARTNLLLNNAALSTQSVTVTAQPYVLSFYGTGSVTLSGAATGTVTGLGAFPARQTYVVTPTAGTLTLTVSGSVQFAQLEAGWQATMPIITYATSQTRVADVATLTIAASTSDIRFTFGDKSWQDIAVSSGSYTIPTALNRYVIGKISSIRQYGSTIGRDDFTSGWSNLSNTSVSQDTVNTTTGASSLLVTSTATGTCRVQKTVSLDLSADAAWFRLRFHVPPTSTATISSIEVGLWDSIGRLRSFNVWFSSHGRRGSNEVAFPINVSWDWQSSAPEPVMASITKVTVGFDATAIGAQVIFDEITEFTPVQSVGRLMAGFDGSLTAMMPCMDWAVTNGVPLTLFTNGNYLNNAGNMTSAQVASYKAQGISFGCYAGTYLSPWSSGTDAQKLSAVENAQADLVALGFSDGARFLSISGNGGITLQDQQRLIGPKLDFIMGSADGSQYEHVMRGDPYAGFTWFSGTQTVTQRLPAMSFSALCDKVIACKGTLVLLAHINSSPADDNATTWIALMEIAKAKGMSFITPQDYVREIR